MLVTPAGSLDPLRDGLRGDNGGLVVDSTGKSRKVGAEN